MTEQKLATSSSPPGPKYFNPVAFVRSLPDPTGLMFRTRDRYGDTYRLPSIFGPVVVTGDPEGVRAIFMADADTFVPFQPQIPRLGERFVEIMNENNVTLADLLIGLEIERYGKPLDEISPDAP